MNSILTFILLFLLLNNPGFSENKQGDSGNESDTYKRLGTEIGDFSIKIPSLDVSGGVATTKISDISTPSMQEMLLLSLSAEDYPVTPGDTYQLTYITAGSPITTLTVVASDYTTNLGVLGNIDAEGLTFLDLKEQIEQKILRAYPDSSPSITIVSNGQFRVFIKGEVTNADYAKAWGLTLLSQVIEDYLTPYASIRDVMVISKSGQGKKFDLFKAIRFGERDQDPYVLPGDTVVVSKRDRAIRLSGAVRREGVYQPLANEELEELIEYYGDGFTEIADRSRIRLQRLITENNKIAESFVFDLGQGFSETIELRDLDTITVPEKTEYMPVIFVEGAIRSESDLHSNNSNDKLIEEYNKLIIQFAEGETLYSVLKDRQEQIDPNADLANAYVIRKHSAGIIPVNLETLLYSYKPQDDFSLEAYDRLVIPPRRYTVLVTGGVIDRGQYPYLPNKTYRYYVDLAGGVDPESGNLNAVRITDRDNNRISIDLYIDPESRIHVPYSFSYYFLKYFPIAVSSATAIYYIVLIFEIFDKIP